jgi:hypothetical protein
MRKQLEAERHWTNAISLFGNNDHLLAQPFPEEIIVLSVQI